MLTAALTERKECGAPEREQPSPPAPGLTQRATLNGVASLLDYGARVLVGLAVTPVLVASLGASLFGVWEMLGRLIGYLAAGDGRPTEALRLVIANQQALDDGVAKRRQVGSALGVWLMFLPGFTVGGLALVWLSPAITKVSDEFSPAVRWACGILVANLLLGNLAALPESVLRGMNLGYRRMGLQAGLWVVSGLLMAGAAYTGLGLPGVAAAQVAVTALSGLLFWFVVKKYVPWFGIAAPSRAELRAFLGISLWNFAGVLVARLLLASDVIILGLAASTVTVTAYVLSGYAAQGVTGLVSLVLLAATPGLGGVVGRKEYDRAAALRAEMIGLGWLLVTVSGSTILVWNRSFLHLWVGGEHYAGVWADFLLVLVMVQTCFIRTDSYVIDATLRLGLRVTVSMVALILVVGLAIALTPSLGVTGLCFGMLGGRMIQTVAYPCLVEVCLGRRPRLGQLGGMVRPGLVTLLLFAGSGYLGQRVLAGNWAVWVAGAGTTVVAALALALLGGMSAASRGLLVRRMKMLRFRAGG